MMYEISNTRSAEYLGRYWADSPQNALEAMARDAGYQSYAEVLDLGEPEPGEILVQALTRFFVRDQRTESEQYATDAEEAAKQHCAVGAWEGLSHVVVEVQAARDDQLAFEPGHLYGDNGEIFTESLEIAV